MKKKTKMKALKIAVTGGTKNKREADQRKEKESQETVQGKQSIQVEKLKKKIRHVARMQRHLARMQQLVRRKRRVAGVYPPRNSCHYLPSALHAVKKTPTFLEIHLHTI